MHQHRQSRVSGVQSQLTVGQAKDSRYLELSLIGITHLKVLFCSLRLLLQVLKAALQLPIRHVTNKPRYATAAAARQVSAMVK